MRSYQTEVMIRDGYTSVAIYTPGSLISSEQLAKILALKAETPRERTPSHSAARKDPRDATEVLYESGMPRHGRKALRSRPGRDLSATVAIKSLDKCYGLIDEPALIRS